MIKNATFTSVWDSGTEITTNCKVNMETREVFDIEVNNSSEIEGLNVLDYEYITVDGIDYPVCNAADDKDGLEETSFWYE